MSIERETTKALCFDLGNTLIEFGPRQIAVLLEAMRVTLEELFGPCDLEKLRAVRDRQIVAPYRNGYRENDLGMLGKEVVRELYGREAEEGQLAELARSRHHAFVEVVEVEPEVRALLERLAPRYRLALLSNYPCGRSIRDGLTKLGLTELFEVIVVSGEVGFVKPHQRPYRLLLEGLELPASECVYVGDNWLADIQGAKGIGMGAIHTTEHVPYERFEPHEGDHEPDARITRLGQLETLLSRRPVPGEA